MSPFGLVPCYLCVLWQAFMMYFVNKATLIHFIDGKCHIKKLERCTTGLTGYYRNISCKLLLIPLVWGHTQTNFLDKGISKDQVCTSLAATNAPSLLLIVDNVISTTINLLIMKSVNWNCSLILG